MSYHFEMCFAQFLGKALNSFFCFQNELQLKCSQVVDRKQVELKTLKKQAEEKIFALEEQLAQAKRGFNGLPFSYLNDDATSPAILS